MAATTFSPGPIGSTCQFTAALRHVESTRVANPLVVDPLARELCGEAALQLAVQELEGLEAAQGVGKHLRVPARTRILEDRLLHELQALQASGCTEVQVVSLGAGLDTRPWRLAGFPAGMSVHWVCMDLPEVMEMKHALLHQAGAETVPRAGALADAAAASSSGGSSGEGGPCRYPLKCSSWHGLGMDLSTIHDAAAEGGGDGVSPAGVLEAALARTGFDKGIPTMYVIEAVLYYMPLDKALVLLAALAQLSHTSSRLIATCVDHELLEASRNLQHGHIFAQLWHFDCDELLHSPCYSQHWRVVVEPRTTKDIAKEAYNADTYVALYGGAECAFTSALA